MQSERLLIIVWALSYGTIVLRLIQVESRLRRLEFDVKQNHSARRLRVNQVSPVQAMAQIMNSDDQ